MPDRDLPEADAIEQEQGVAASPLVPEPVTLRDDVNEADALEQAHPVPLDDEEYGG